MTCRDEAKQEWKYVRHKSWEKNEVKRQPLLPPLGLHNRHQ